MASSAESEEHGSVRKKKLTRLGSFSSKEVFRTWAKDSLLKASTIETLMEVHQVDSLPAVLALRNKDIASLGLPIGQARLFQEAVIKLHKEYTYQMPFSPATRVDVEFPRYKSMLDEGSPVGRQNEAGDYFRFNFGDTASEEMVIEVGEHFCDGKNATDHKLLEVQRFDDDEEDDDDENRFGCACQRWLCISFFMPLILVVALFGCIAWLFLWPINRFCPVGKTFSKLFNAAEQAMKLPVKSIQWAIGKQRTAGERRDQLQELETKRSTTSYGGTDEVTVNELDKTKR